MRTSNPAMQAFVKSDTYGRTLAAAPARTMTVRGTVIASAVLTVLCAIAAVLSYGWIAAGGKSSVFELVGASSIAALVLAFIIMAVPRSAPFLAPVYALAEGAVVGAVSWLVPTMYHKVPEGVVFQALLMTFGILFALLLAYGLGLVRIGSTATRVIAVATAGVAIYYIAVLLLNVLGVQYLSLGWSTSPIGIAFSIFVVVLAALNLVLDFQFIEAGAAGGAPKHMEWYGAWGLLVTLVWLYVETLRLLAKLQRK